MPFAHLKEGNFNFAVLVVNGAYFSNIPIILENCSYKLGYRNIGHTHIGLVCYIIIQSDRLITKLICMLLPTIAKFCLSKTPCAITRSSACDQIALLNAHGDACRESVPGTTFRFRLAKKSARVFPISHYSENKLIGYFQFRVFFSVVIDLNYLKKQVICKNGLNV